MNLRDELLTRIKEEQTQRDNLERDGTLSDEYHPERDSKHIEDARWLDEIITKNGLPKLEDVGILGIEAVCRIINNAISLPTLQKKYLPMLQEKSTAGEYPTLAVALIEDCIAFHEQRSQIYGLYSDWNSDGKLIIPFIDNETDINVNREKLGLIPLQEARQKLSESKDIPPKNYAAKKAAYEAWRIRVGWVTSSAHGTHP